MKIDRSHQDEGVNPPVSFIFFNKTWILTLGKVWYLVMGLTLYVQLMQIILNSVLQYAKQAFTLLVLATTKKQSHKRGGLSETVRGVAFFFFFTIVWRPL